MKPAYGSTPTSEGSAPQAGGGSEREKIAHDKKQQPHSKASGDRTREKEKQPLPAKKDKKRYLSLSGAAMFEAVSNHHLMLSLMTQTLQRRALVLLWRACSTYKV